MRPFDAVFDKSAEELRGGNRTCIAWADILDVCNRRIDQLVICWAHRHPPQLVASRAARRSQLIRQLIAVRIQPAMLLAQGDDNRAG